MNGTKPSGIMPNGKKCPHCGAALPAGALDGLCPACLLKEGAAADTGTAGQLPFNPPPVSELAALFPQLEILEFIGQGGMGAVYKARQKQLDRIVALKILPPGIGDDPAFAGRFAHEAKALARLSHPGIVTLYEFGQVGAQSPSSGLYYFLMEFVDGVNLRQLLQAGRISPREALAIVPQICDALQFAHDQGIVHRDIKPENILLDRRGRVKVADFGLAKIVGTDPSLTDADQVMGTPNYMAPEQRSHPAEADHRVDIYALGVVFYQMLTGELPGKPIVPPSSRARGIQIDVRLDDVVLRAMEKKPQLRYQQVSEVKTLVETIAETADPSRRRPESVATTQRLGRWALGLFLAGTLGTLLLMTISPRHELALIFGGLALLLGVIFGVMSWRERLGKGVVIATLVLFAGLGIVAIFNFVWVIPVKRIEAEARRQATIKREQALYAQEMQMLAQTSNGLSALRKPEDSPHTFVRLVVDKAAMTFEGRPTTWEDVGTLLDAVTDRPRTVLEFAVTSDQITVQQQNEWFGNCIALANSHGFAHASFIGVHPLGSKGTQAARGNPNAP